MIVGWLFSNLIIAQPVGLRLLQLGLSALHLFRVETTTLGKIAAFCASMSALAISSPKFHLSPNW